MQAQARLFFHIRHALGIRIPVNTHRQPGGSGVLKVGGKVGVLLAGVLAVPGAQNGKVNAVVLYLFPVHLFLPSGNIYTV